MTISTCRNSFYSIFWTNTVINSQKTDYLMRDSFLLLDSFIYEKLNLYDESKSAWK